MSVERLVLTFQTTAAGKVVASVRRDDTSVSYALQRWFDNKPLAVAWALTTAKRELLEDRTDDGEAA